MQILLIYTVGRTCSANLAAAGAPFPKCPPVDYPKPLKAILLFINVLDPGLSPSYVVFRTAYV